MWVQVTDVVRSEVFITKGFDYEYKKRNPLRRAKNMRYGSLRGLDYYVIAHSISIFASSFKVETWIEKAKPPPPRKGPKIVDPEDVQLKAEQPKEVQGAES